MKKLRDFFSFQLFRNPLNLFLWSVLGISFFQSVSAAPHERPTSLTADLLSETHPFVLSPPAELTTGDYKIVWSGPQLSNVSVEIEKDSLQWTRVRSVYVIPKARVFVRAKGIEAGALENSGFTQPLIEVSEKKDFQAKLPIALISGPKNKIQIRIKRNGKILKSSLEIRFHPLKQNQGLVTFDTSCSSFHLKAIEPKIKTNSWVHVGCRFSNVQATEHRSSSLELFVFWDNVGQTINLNDLPVSSANTSVWNFRVRAEPGLIRLNQGSQKLELSYRIPKNNRRGFIGAGIGPYLYTYTDRFEPAETIAPVLTLYGGVSVGEGMRIVMFNASNLHTKFSTDLGLYFMVEQKRFLDERIIARLLLGGHVLGFTYNQAFRVEPSFPQGAELVFLDFLKPRYNLSFGAFLYPNINDVSYNNLWIRWGTAGFFIEYNFISWTQPIHGEVLYSRSNGISVGFPIARIF